MDRDRSTQANQIDGTVNGPTVQANSITGGVHFHLSTVAGNQKPGHDGGSDAHPPAGPPPDGWASLPSLPADVLALMHAQVQAAQDLPYQLRGAKRPSLATVYVRQGLSTGGEDLQTEQPPMPVLDSNGQLVTPPNPPVVRLAVRPPSRTLRAALDDDEHLLVTGGPGQGKSTLSLRLAADIATRWLAPGPGDEPLTEPVLPVRLPARELASRLELPFYQAIAAGLRAEYGAFLHAPVRDEVLGDRVAGCRWLLLVDGLDEVANDAERDRLVSVLSGCASTPGRSVYRVVLTTRPIEGAALAPLQRIGAARYELQPFDKAALERFATNWFAEGTDASRFLRQIHEAHMDELVTVPLLATIAAIIFEQHDDRPLPDNQYELYEAYLVFLRSSRPLASQGLFDEHRTALLEHLGRIRLTTDASLVTTARQWVTEHLTTTCLPSTWQEDVISFLASVGPLRLRGHDLTFLHHSFAEHLAATADARELPPQFDSGHDGFARLLHTAPAKESGQYARAVLLHYTRLLPAAADRLLRWLHARGAEQHLLAARLLARHVPAGTAVVTEFLTTARAWAMTTRYPANEILREASRATHHAGLVTWLADLMRDESVPWESRAEAAAALAIRLRGAHTIEAVALLRTVVDDASAPVGRRLLAAEALAQCGPAEHTAAAQGLRAVLRDRHATGADCRAAAVVLSALGPETRQVATETLLSIVDDVDTPTNDLVEAATGLIEIGAEFDERCTTVFERVLRDPVGGTSGRSDAALGLASLGPEYLAVAVDALTATIEDRGRSRFDRASLAQALAKLGPQHRVTAGHRLVALLAEPGVSLQDRWWCAARLAQCGPEFRERAVSQLRLVIHASSVTGNVVQWAASALADLGPEFQDEAAEALWQVAHSAMTIGAQQVNALGQLAGFDEPHRSRAIGLLHERMADYRNSPRDRSHAAQELVSKGPEHHAAVRDHLHAVTKHQPELQVATQAWRELVSLDPGCRATAFETMVRLLRMLDSHAEVPVSAVAALASADARHVDEAADALTSLARDETRSVRSRISACTALVTLGRRFHPTAATEASAVLVTASSPEFDISMAIMTFTRAGVGPRTTVADTLSRMVLDPNAMSARRWHVAQAMNTLGFGSRPEVSDALRSVVTDESLTAHLRDDAGVLLARVAPEHLADVATRVLGISEGMMPYGWRRTVTDLAALGADVLPRLLAIMSNSDAETTARAAAARVLGELCPELAVDAITELTRYADDPFLDGASEGMWQYLTELDPSRLGDVVGRLRAMVGDEGESVRNRTGAAELIATLEWKSANEHVALLRRFVNSPLLAPEERWRSVRDFYYAIPFYSDELINVITSALHQPEMLCATRYRLLDLLPTTLDSVPPTTIERAVLRDRSAPLHLRLPPSLRRGPMPLTADIVAEVLDTFAGPETTPAERVAAAAALADVSLDLVPEAVRKLEQLIAESRASHAARVRLATLGNETRDRTLSWAHHVVEDTSHAPRERLRAAMLIIEFTAAASGPAVAVLRQVVADARTSETVEVDARFALRHADGLNGVRRLRDDERSSPAVRWRAATKLLDRDVEDRAAGAHVLRTVAGDPSVPPPLRSRAAQTLTSLGPRGRELGTTILSTIAEDSRLPAVTRAKAARALSDVRPTRRRDALTILGELVDTPNPLHRIQVLRVLATIDPTRAVVALHAMTTEDRLSPLARLRCAEAMVEFRRDQREPAAVVARSVAWDASVAPHIRLHAACDLALWSELCRAEARQLIRALREPATA